MGGEWGGGGRVEERLKKPTEEENVQTARAAAASSKHVITVTEHSHPVRNIDRKPLRPKWKRPTPSTRSCWCRTAGPESVTQCCRNANNLRNRLNNSSRPNISGAATIVNLDDIR